MLFSEKAIIIAYYNYMDNMRLLVYSCLLQLDIFISDINDLISYNSCV